MAKENILNVIRARAKVASQDPTGKQLHETLGKLCACKTTETFKAALLTQASKTPSPFGERDVNSLSEADLKELSNDCKKLLAKFYAEKLLEQAQPWLWPWSKKLDTTFFESGKYTIQAVYTRCAYPSDELFKLALNTAVNAESRIDPKHKGGVVDALSSEQLNSNPANSVKVGEVLEPWAGGRTSIIGGPPSPSRSRSSSLSSISADDRDEEAVTQTLLIDRLTRLNQIEKDYFAKKRETQPDWEAGVTVDQKLENLKTETLSAKELNDAMAKIERRLKSIPYNILWEQQGNAKFDSARIKTENFSAFQNSFITSTSVKSRVVGVTASSHDFKPDYILPDETICVTRTCQRPGGGESKVLIKQDLHCVEDCTPFSQYSKTSQPFYKPFHSVKGGFSEKDDQENAIQVAMMLLASVDKKNPHIRLYGADTAQVQRVHAVLLICKNNNPEYKNLDISSSHPTPAKDKMWPFNVIMSGGSQNASIQNLMTEYKGRLEALRVTKAAPSAPTLEIETLDPKNPPSSTIL